MPAILRIFVYQTVASHTVIGSYAVYGRVGVRRAGSATVWTLATACGSATL